MNLCGILEGILTKPLVTFSAEFLWKFFEELLGKISRVNIYGILVGISGEIDGEILGEFPDEISLRIPGQIRRNS